MNYVRQTLFANGLRRLYPNIFKLEGWIDHERQFKTAKRLVTPLF